MLRLVLNLTSSIIVTHICNFNIQNKDILRKLLSQNSLALSRGRILSQVEEGLYGSPFNLKALH